MRRASPRSEGLNVSPRLQFLDPGLRPAILLLGRQRPANLLPHVIERGGMGRVERIHAQHDKVPGGLDDAGALAGLELAHLVPECIVQLGDLQPVIRVMLRPRAVSLGQRVVRQIRAVMTCERISSIRFRVTLLVSSSDLSSRIQRNLMRAATVNPSALVILVISLDLERRNDGVGHELLPHHIDNDVIPLLVAELLPGHAVAASSSLSNRTRSPPYLSRITF